MEDIMLKEFEGLTDMEMELMLKAPILVCILIAGADGEIDRKEIKEAITTAKKQKRDNATLKDYFKEVSQDFEDKLKVVLQHYPTDSESRNEVLTSELAHLNSLWKKMDRSFTISFYAMLKDLAQRVASSSGGLWGIKTIGAEEARYVNLPMVKDPSM